MTSLATRTSKKITTNSQGDTEMQDKSEQDWVKAGFLIIIKKVKRADAYNMERRAERVYRKRAVQNRQTHHNNLKR